MKYFLRLVCTLILLFSFVVPGYAAAQKRPDSIVYNYYNFKLPKTGYRYEILPYTNECNCTEIDMFPTIDLNQRLFVTVFGVYKDEAGAKLSTSKKYKKIKEQGGSAKLINGVRWWYIKYENGSETYTYEPGYSTIGYRVLVVPEKDINHASLKIIYADVEKVIKSIKIKQKKPTQFP